MIHSVTTSIRLPPKMRSELEKASHKLHRGKNWIIIQALEAYLSSINQVALAEEARRQSLLASQAEDEASRHWEDDTDTTGWI